MYLKPVSKTNRSIVLNAIEHVVFPGLVNSETRKSLVEVIDNSDSLHFLLLFRDLNCQFRGLYVHYADTKEILKIYGTGPKQAEESMFETFFK